MSNTNTTLTPEQVAEASIKANLAGDPFRLLDFARAIESEVSKAYEARIAELEVELKATQAYAELNLHKVITCGVAASHPDKTLSRRKADYGGKWNSPQAEQVRILRDQLEALQSPTNSEARVDELIRAEVDDTGRPLNPDYQPPQPIAAKQPEQVRDDLLKVAQMVADGNFNQAECIRLAKAALQSTSPSEHSAQEVRKPFMQFDLDEDTADNLSEYIAGDKSEFGQRPISFFVGDGHSGYGLYVADTEYLDEGCQFVVAANSALANTDPVHPDNIQHAAETRDGK